jgi:hypothetical protein
MILELLEFHPYSMTTRFAFIAALAVLEITEVAETLTQAINAAGMLPPRAVRDAAHFAVAAVQAIDYFLTGNCKHLANAQIARRMALVCEKPEHRRPII